MRSAGFATHQKLRRAIRAHQVKEARSRDLLGLLLSIAGAVGCAFAGVLVADCITDAGYVVDLLAALAKGPK